MENRRGQGFLLGLTGGVGAGKSTVLSYLEEAYGFHVIQTDLTARRLMEPGMEGFQTAVRLFGADILDASGAICRPVLAERMFREPEKRRQSDAAIHPLVWKAVREEAAAFRNGPVVIETAVPGKEFRDSCREIWIFILRRRFGLPACGRAGDIPRRKSGISWPARRRRDLCRPGGRTPGQQRFPGADPEAD